MKSIYYLNSENNVCGPVSEDELKNLHLSQAITALTQVCREGDSEWVPYHKACEKWKNQPIKLEMHENDANRGQGETPSRLTAITPRIAFNRRLALIGGVFIISTIILILGILIFSSGTSSLTQEDLIGHWKFDDDNSHRYFNGKNCILIDNGDIHNPCSYDVISINQWNRTIDMRMNSLLPQIYKIHFSKNKKHISMTSIIDEKTNLAYKEQLTFLDSSTSP